jgi:hypothetical protein
MRSHKIKKKYIFAFLKVFILQADDVAVGGP